MDVFDAPIQPQTARPQMKECSHRACAEGFFLPAWVVDWARIVLVLQASELVSLRWDDIDFMAGKLHVRRAKGGTTGVHPVGGRELRPAEAKVWDTGKRLAPVSVAGYQRMVARAGATAGFRFLAHSHTLRHSCGHKSANDGQDTRAIQDYLGVRYTALALDRFKNFWKDWGRKTAIALPALRNGGHDGGRRE
jgi:integrase